MTFVGEGLVLISVVLHLVEAQPQVADVLVHLCTEDMSLEGCHIVGAWEPTLLSLSFLSSVLLCSILFRSAVLGSAVVIGSQPLGLPYY